MSSSSSSSLSPFHQDADMVRKKRRLVFQLYQRQPPPPQRRRRQENYDNDDGYNYDSYYDEKKVDPDDEEEENDPYWNSSRRDDRKSQPQDYATQNERQQQQSQPQKQSQKQQRGGMYKVYFDDDVDPIETQLDWEKVEDENESGIEALVLLPPAVVERPTAILHFVGGTFFGSAPKLWYRTLLEGLVRNTQCAIVVTPIPVTLFSSPLNHVELCQKLQRSFQYAWDVILSDEYGGGGSDADDDSSSLKNVPLCGVGHSLGARLLTVQATLTQNKVAAARVSSRYGGTIPVPPYKAMVLISFTNFGASAGIPGVSALLRQSRNNERTKQVSGERQRQKTAQRARQDWWTDDYGYDDEEEENYNDDDDWNTLLEDVQEIFQQQAARVKTALTPNSRDLEFHPTPDQLWKALRDDGRYAVPETLLVQFDDDRIDQSSKLATILQSTNATQLKFARLRGNHLSPISVQEEGEDDNGSNGATGWLELSSSKVSNSIWKVIRGRSKTKLQEATMRDVKQSIARFITDVVTK
jgi:Protein of unknown function (DUF1350)